MKRPRLQAVITGKARELGALEAHERNVMAIARRIAGKERKLRAALSTIAQLRKELRADRRELRAILQRDPNATESRLELAGPADATDRSIALAEHRAAAPDAPGRLGDLEVPPNREITEGERAPEYWLKPPYDRAPAAEGERLEDDPQPPSRPDDPFGGAGR